MKSFVVGVVLFLGLWTQAQAQQCWQLESASSRIQLHTSTVQGQCFASVSELSQSYFSRATAIDSVPKYYGDGIWSWATGFALSGTHGAPFTCIQPGNAAVGTTVYCGYRYQHCSENRWIPTPPSCFVSDTAGEWFSARLRSACAVGTAWTAAANTCVPIVETDITQTPPQCPYGNPIYPVSGVKRQPLDLNVNIGWLSASLTYDTSRRTPTTTAVEGQSLDAVPASFGSLWLSNLHRKLVVDAGLRAARVSRGNGQLTSFTGNGSGVFTAVTANVNDKLLSVSGGYRFFDAANQTMESYTGSGVLTRIDHAAGQSLVFSYSDSATPPSVAPSSGLLITVTDVFGRSLQFKYNAAGLVNQIVDPAGQTIATAYVNGNLSQMTWQDGSVRSFLYENASLAWALTGMLDEQGARIGTYSYDAQGRAVATEGAGGVDRFAASYSSPPAIVVTDTYDASANVIRRTRTWQLPLSTTVTTPNGSSVGLGVEMVAGSPVITSRSQPAGAGCAPSTSLASHDANGNLASADDFNGSRTCYASDLSRNLETSRVEGLSNSNSCAAVTPPGTALPGAARKTSSQWHPDWRLRSKTAEPGRMTTYIYNGQPDPFAGNTMASCAPAAATLPDGKPIAVLCKQVEQATTDANGAVGFAALLQAGVPPRVRNWTYNQAGQVLSASDPAGNTSTNAYYTSSTADYSTGDLQSITNALGHLTRHTRYGSKGQLLESIDANGVVTTYAYDLRQRLVSTTTAGLTTIYSYSATGLPTRVTQANGSYIGYSYDAAQRMTAMFDHLGNRIDYTLDATGNRIAEATKDPGGTLRRQLARSYDALGRVQQVTGRE